MQSERAMGHPTMRSPIWVYLFTGLVLAVAASLLIGRPLIQAPVGEGVTGHTRYHDKRDGFSLAYPDTWRQLDPSEMRRFQGAFSFAIRREDPSALLGVRVQPVKARNVSLSAVARALDKELPLNFREFRKSEQSMLRVATGEQALKYVYTFVSDSGAKVSEQLVVVPSAGKAYHVAGWAPAARFRETGRELDSIAESFRSR